STRDFRIFLLPIAVVLATLAVRRLRERSRDEPAHGLLASASIYGVALLAAVVPWVAIFLRLIGPERFARQILFIGTGFEQYYYIAFHPMTLWDRRVVDGALALILVGLLARHRLLPARVVTFGAALAGMAMVAVAALAPMPNGFHAAVVSRAEDIG